MIVSAQQISQLCPHVRPSVVAQFLAPLNDAMIKFKIDTPLRISAFLAQVAHESGEFRWWQEIWGPTEAQRRYEPPNKLAAVLGNTQPGDGMRFRGRGLIQLTGRANYRRAGEALGLPLETKPEIAASYYIGPLVAAWFWDNKKLNTLADQRNLRQITIAINGGVNGYADRFRLWKAAQKIFGVTAEAPRATATDQPDGE